LYSILAAGRPYVAAVEDDCEVVDITRKHQCGVIVAPGDAEALAARVLEIYRDGPRAAELGQRAREAGLTFDRPRQIAAYAALLRRVAGRDARSEVRACETSDAEARV
jgi:hypothetical protein